MHIGVAGLGAMGAAIAARLMEVGHQVTVWNRIAGKGQAAGRGRRQGRGNAGRGRRPREAVITILTDGAAIDAVYNGPKGLLSGDVQRQAVHRDEHGAAGGRNRAGAQGARQGRGHRRMPGRRLDGAGAARASCSG